MKHSKKPFYGFYAFGRFHIIISVWFLIGILILLFLNQLIGIGVLIFGIYMYLTYWIGQFLAKPHKAYDFSWLLRLKGDETVLDVGCGLGKATIGVAKLLNTGIVIGIDIWDKFDIKGISLQRASRNAEVEKVKDRIEFKSGNLMNLPFPDNSFNMVLSSGVFLTFWSNKPRYKALVEIQRVLRPNGKLLFIEPLKSALSLTICPGMAWKFLSKKRCIKLLKNSGFINLSENYRDINGLFIAEKPK